MMTSSPTDRPSLDEPNPNPFGRDLVPPHPVRRGLRLFFPLIVAGLLLLAASLWFRPQPSSDGAVFAIDPSRNLVGLEIFGEDAAGRAYRLKAGQGSMGLAERISGLGEAGELALQQIEAEFQLEHGEQPAYGFIRAASGLYHPAQTRLKIAPNASIFFTQGYEVHGGQAELDFTNTSLIVAGPLEAWGPQFTLEAGRFRAEGVQEKLHFSDGVRLTLFLPPASGEQEQP